MEDEKEHKKLYAHINCTSCRGGQENSGCYYCDERSKIFVEASVKTIIEYIRTMPKDLQDKIKKGIR